MMKVGFSTGALFKTHDTKGALKVMRQLGCPCVELGFLEPGRLRSGWLDRVTQKDVEGFEYVSLHAPAIPYGNDDESSSVFERILRFHNDVRPLDRVVFHPNLIEDFSILAATGLPIGVENMDWRKESMKRPDEFHALFVEHPDWKLVLDLNHIYTIDPTMALAHEFYRMFGDRMAHVHLSGFTTLHDPLFATQQRQIIRALERTDVPIIDESGMDVEDLEKERSYVLDSLASSE